MKTLQKTLIICLFTIPLCAESQAPPPPPPPAPVGASGHVSRADSLLRAGDIGPAVEEYRNMYLRNRNDRLVIYNYACALSLAGHPDSAISYLEKVVEINPSVSILTDPDLLAVRESPGWEEFENGLIAALNENTSNSITDTDYASSLWRLLCLDQTGFYEMGIAVRNLGSGSPVVTALRRMQALQNEKNLAELEALLDSKGWPEKSQVGSDASEAAFYVLQHANTAAQKKYIKLFEEACIKNEGNWQQYALLFDRMRITQNLPQKYGTHAILDNRTTGELILYPLEDENRVDEWRKEKGLEPLNEYMARAGIKR